MNKRNAIVGLGIIFVLALVVAGYFVLRQSKPTPIGDRIQDYSGKPAKGDIIDLMNSPYEMRGGLQVTPSKGIGDYMFKEGRYLILTEDAGDLSVPLYSPTAQILAVVEIPDIEQNSEFLFGECRSPEVAESAPTIEKVVVALVNLENRQIQGAWMVDMEADRIIPIDTTTVECPTRALEDFYEGED